MLRSTSDVVAVYHPLKTLQRVKHALTGALVVSLALLLLAGALTGNLSLLALAGMLVAGGLVALFGLEWVGPYWVRRSQRGRGRLRDPALSDWLGRWLGLPSLEAVVLEQALAVDADAPCAGEPLHAAALAQYGALGLRWGVLALTSGKLLYAARADTRRHQREILPVEVRAWALDRVGPLEIQASLALPGGTFHDVLIHLDGQPTEWTIRTPSGRAATRGDAALDAFLGDAR